MSVENQDKAIDESHHAAQTMSSSKSSARRSRVQGAGWAQAGTASSVGYQRPSPGADRLGNVAHFHTYEPYNSKTSNKQSQSGQSFVNSLRPTSSEKHKDNAGGFSASRVSSIISSASNTRTTVVNIRKAELKKRGYSDLQDWLKNPNHVYIGRDMTRYVPGAVGSKWGNPFKSRVEGRSESCKRYRDYVITDTQRRGPDGKTLFKSLHELKGKTLGCWCHPEMCHGHVLAKLIEEHCA